MLINYGVLNLNSILPSRPSVSLRKLFGFSQCLKGCSMSLAKLASCTREPGFVLRTTSSSQVRVGKFGLQTPAPPLAPKCVVLNCVENDY